MILMIDNYDSFTYNLVQYCGQLGAEMVVHRNDKITIEEIEELSPEKIIISPGPCTPLEAGISNDVIRRFKGEIPILGICLGHQCIGHVFGAEIVRAENLMHGKTSKVYHNEAGIFEEIESPFIATRYHSLIIKKETIPDSFEITAKTKAGEIMGIKHKEYDIVGLQFHPESILTRAGHDLLANFLELPKLDCNVIDYAG
ncbi:anthranilate synthase component II [Selenihalanaerobacter shriftii]|uniref:Anthranilate synthase component 2 n=1 Tax=Selenihalanaerobacter shriftii TaxID=142842 RepID=A0A1T4NQR3_9FIRM|nr:aminodeoxychorismate/anthranilate synthase component II [Selenihalanaerobacter shriftii]SJZ81416.1 anthranilate synthase component 2 [Selenihalanaerobacter shriftii]